MTINWHKNHDDDMTVGERLADNVALFMGSWKFIILQTIIVVAWILMNIIGIFYHWDEYPFLLLNIIFSTQAAYAAPIIMQSQNRQAERDRHHAEADYNVNLMAKNEIEQLQKDLARMEIDKLDKILAILQHKD